MQKSLAVVRHSIEEYVTIKVEAQKLTTLGILVIERIQKEEVDKVVCMIGDGKITGS